MNQHEKPIENAAAKANQDWSDEATARYRDILMRLLEETKREFDQWPEWKKQYSITTRAY